MNEPIKFTIFGNQEHADGNPIPYERSTQNGQWKPKVKRYNAWKDFVRWALIDAAPDGYARELKLRTLRGEKPIDLGGRMAIMNIKIFWKNGVHGDCDNIWKGISDAIFQNDKHVGGSFSYEYSTDKKGKVEITIKI